MQNVSNPIWVIFVARKIPSTNIYLLYELCFSRHKENVNNGIRSQHSVTRLNFCLIMMASRVRRMHKQNASAKKIFCVATSE